MAPGKLPNLEDIGLALDYGVPSTGEPPTLGWEDDDDEAVLAVRISENVGGSSAAFAQCDRTTKKGSCRVGKTELTFNTAARGASSAVSRSPSAMELQSVYRDEAACEEGTIAKSAAHWIQVPNLTSVLSGGN